MATGGDGHSGAAAINLRLVRPAQWLPVVVAVTLAFACTPDDAPSPAAAFYAEVAVEVHPSPSDTLARFGLGDSRSIVRWWYAGDPVRWRWEVETVGTIIDDGVILWVGDGIDSWTYDDRSNIYQRQTVEGMPVGLASPLSFSAPVGPANVESIDAFTEQWRERGGDPEVAVAGEATVLGRPTQIVELRYSAGGLFRAFIDPERMFIMRWAVDGEVGGQTYRAEVTVLDYDTDIDAGRFTFEPPHDARETEALGNQSCSGSSGPLGTGAAFPREPRLADTIARTIRLSIDRGRRRRQRVRLRPGRLVSARRRRGRLHSPPPARSRWRHPAVGPLVANRRFEPRQRLPPLRERRRQPAVARGRYRRPPRHRLRLVRGTPAHRRIGHAVVAPEPTTRLRHAGDRVDQRLGSPGTGARRPATAGVRPAQTIDLGHARAALAHHQVMAQGDVREETILPRASDASQQSNEEGKPGAHASLPSGKRLGGRALRRNLRHDPCLVVLQVGSPSGRRGVSRSSTRNRYGNRSGNPCR